MCNSPINETEQLIESALEWNNAEQQRKNKNFNEALNFFLKNYENHKDEESLWRTIHCLRNLNNFSEASELACKGLELFPDSVAIKNQINWLRYETKLLPEIKAKNHEQIIKTAKEIMVNVNPNELLFKLMLFSAIDSAKAIKDYEEIIELTNLTEPDNLEAKSREWKGRKIISWRERWYYARLKALFELKEFEACRHTALNAFNDFPKSAEFLRRAALCLVALNNKEQALKELQKLVNKARVSWYIKADLAKLYFETGNLEQALKYCILASQDFGQPKSKVNLYLLTSKILLALGETKPAKYHAELAASLRSLNGWKQPDELNALLMHFNLNKPYQSHKLLLNSCKQFWQNFNKKLQDNQKKLLTNEGEIICTNCTGSLILKNPESPFAFIKTEKFKEVIYLKTSDLPANTSFDKAKLIFDVVKSFDRVKQKEGKRAVNIRNAEN